MILHGLLNFPLLSKLSIYIYIDIDIYLSVALDRVRRGF